MNNSTRFAVLTFALLVVLVGGVGSTHAGGNRTGGTGLYLTHSADTLDPGALRLGAFGQYVRYVVWEDPETWDFAPQLAWSPVRDLEVSFAMPLLRYQVNPDSKETGVGDGVVGLKYRLFPHVAALSYVSLPFGDENRSLGSGGADVGVAGIFSFPLGAGVTTDLNVGYQFTGFSGTEGDDFLFYGIGLSVPVGSRTRIFGEVAGREDLGGRRSHDTLQFDLGLRHQVNDRVALTVGAGKGMNGDYGPEDSRLRLFAGLEFLFGGRGTDRGSAAVGGAAPGGGAPGGAAPGGAAPGAGAPGAGAPGAGAPGGGAPGGGAPGGGAPGGAAPGGAPTVTAAPAHTAAELDAAKKRLAAAEVLFEYDRTRLTPEGERALKQITADMLKYSEISFAIEGHADSRGTSSYNKTLGLRRAETVMRYMVKAGIGFDRMKIVTQGEMKPKVPNKDARGMALNRRVVFSVL